MDNPGWHAYRRAQKEEEALARDRDYRNSYYAPPNDDVAPMEETFIGGFRNHPHPVAMGPPSPRPPVPPKDYPYPQPIQNAPSNQTQSTISTKHLTQMSAVERSQKLRVARMEPHLQFMCGPLLRYDTIDEHGVWHGAALVVSQYSLFLRFLASADSGSVYEPFPSLNYSWDPSAPPPLHQRKPTGDSYPSPVNHSHSQSSTNDFQSVNNLSTTTSRPSTVQKLHSAASYELGPHPADPHSTILPASPTVSVLGNNTYPFSVSEPTSFAASPNGYPATNNGDLPPGTRSETVAGQELWVYGGTGGTFTFWRFLIKVPLGEHEMAVRYSVNHGQQLEFWVPGRNQNMRWAAHSCNGFSAGVNPDDFRGPGFKSGYDPVWMDLLSKHQETPFHLLVGGGDQLYCDSLMREAEMQDWSSKMKPEERKQYPLTEEIESTIDRFFFNHYCQAFRSGAFARANCSIPMANMCDDHGEPYFWFRISIDGFGSYPDDMQRAPVFRQIGARGYFFFLLFQCFINVEIDGVSDLPGKHTFKSTIIGQPGPYVRFPSHSTLHRLGPQTYMLMLDCRAERKKEQVCSREQYQKVFGRLNSLPMGVEHLVVQLGIPIAYPRMVFLETALESKFNPLVALGRNGSLGLSGFVNKFNAEAELLDDLNDHWTARSHKKERNWLVEQLQNFARIKHIRVTFISGDVHCGAVGLFKTLRLKGKPEIAPQNDHKWMANIVTSAIVNTPPPNGVITLVSSLASKVHKTMHSSETDEIMVPIFEKEPSNGQPRKQKYIMGARNWCRVEWNQENGDMIFELRVEKQKGYGVTTGYPMVVPPPVW
ncbi:hypothetical protein CVT24_010428 [Panaeolus cyanescens]|uniref:PhoD-like phosphatase domain-containing protein n=1 Tax=Panaeolus cyanescens TaxID=181874 RepID=A0A409YPN7_9AGAR|nr:hypothetical protein CVT24_010428 [Panaeolus cyanescens]